LRRVLYEQHAVVKRFACTAAILSSMSSKNSTARNRVTGIRIQIHHSRAALELQFARACGRAADDQCVQWPPLRSSNATVACIASGTNQKTAARVLSLRAKARAGNSAEGDRPSVPSLRRRM